MSGGHGEQQSNQMNGMKQCKGLINEEHKTRNKSKGGRCKINRTHGRIGKCEARFTIESGSRNNEQPMT